MKISFRSMLGRLTGFSTPVFGIQWHPSESDRVRVERVLTVLEDRRILLPYGVLINYVAQPSYITKSVEQIRAFLTGELQELERESDLFERLDTMRQLCRYLLDVFEVAQITDLKEFEDRRQNTHAYWPAVMEFKTRMGLQIAGMAVAYGVDLPANMARELPSDLEKSAASDERLSR